MVNESKKYIITVLILTFILLSILGTLVIIIDPYFHYHKPFKWISYTLNNQRYQNDGILKHFDYDAIITGTSMTENFKTSELDELFNVNGVKVSFSGASFKEINDNLVTALNYNKNIKIIIRCIDLYKINVDKDKLEYDIKSYPTYLYDKNIFNDIKYILNKNIIINSAQTLNHSIHKEKSTTFDDYSSWYQYFIFSKESVDSRYTRIEKHKVENITKNDYTTIKENIMQNIIKTANKYPNVEFYLFYPPYSIYYWDWQNQSGILDKQIDIIDYATKLLVDNQPNIHLYSFLNEFDIITNLNNYKDYEHYSEKINSLILEKMNKNENLININNYTEHINEIRNFYKNYNYDELFK